MPTIIQESLGSKMLMKIQSEEMAVDARPETDSARHALAKEIRSSVPVPNKVNCMKRAKTKIVFGNVAEEDLLRDLLFVFQGIDGKYISYSILDDTYSISASV